MNDATSNARLPLVMGDAHIVYQEVIIADIANCPAAHSPGSVKGDEAGILAIESPCPKDWNLMPTLGRDCRYCSHCEQPVYRVRSKKKLRELAGTGVCVAYTPAKKKHR